MNTDSHLIIFKSESMDRYEIEQEGRRIYNTNVFMRSLTNIMENPEFSSMFEQYFDTWDNIEIFVLFAKVYHSITKQCPEMNGYEKISLVKKIMDNSKTRQLVCQEIRNFSNVKHIKN